ncbi:MAG: SPOR domain-containing protein [Alphaproteobacteria bacterium]
MPPMVSYASLAMDGISYATTGKSVSDHALSAATNQDCAVWRAVSEQEIDAVCQDPAEDSDAEVAADDAANDSWFFAGLFSGNDEAPAADPEPMATLVAAAPADEDVDSLTNSTDFDVIDFDPTKAPVADAVLPATTPNNKAIYLVLGSFKSVARAESLASRVPGITTAIAPALIGEDRYFRVVAGPYELDETAAAEQHLAAAGINNVWAARLCTNDLLAPPCESTSP